MTENDRNIRKDGLKFPDDKSKPKTNGLLPFETTEKKDLKGLDIEELNEKIMSITLLIKGKFPELSKFLNEIPEEISDNPNSEVSTDDLQDYYLSLEAILVKYKQENPNR